MLEAQKKPPASTYSYLSELLEPLAGGNFLKNPRPVSALAVRLEISLNISWYVAWAAARFAVNTSANGGFCGISAKAALTRRRIRFRSWALGATFLETTHANLFSCTATPIVRVKKSLCIQFLELIFAKSALVSRSGRLSIRLKRQLGASLLASSLKHGSAGRRARFLQKAVGPASFALLWLVCTSHKVRLRN